VPIFIFHSFCCSLEKMGALVWHKVVKEHQGWWLITCIWLHAGVIHLLANMFSLIFIGIRLEQEFGFGEFCKLLQAFRQLHISNVYLESEYHIDTHLFYKAN